MADPTPPSDIPDPASPTPATPAPRPGPGPAAGPKRIRSMPDRPASTRPTGTIRSMPETTRASTRSASTYADALGTEKSWKRGLAILWVIIVAAMLLEMQNAQGFVLAGRPGWPLPAEAGRIALVFTSFVALWVGFGWLRYAAALVMLGSSAWLFLIVGYSYKEAPKFWATGESDWTVYSSFEMYIKAALAILYLVRGLYLLFSDDVREFMAHRRARGGILSALLVTVFVYGCMVLIFAAQPFYGKWMQGQRAEMQRFGDDLLRTMSSHWDPATLEPVLDRDYAKSYSKEDRVAKFANYYRELGPLKDANSAPMKPVAPMPQYPLQDRVPLPDDLSSKPGLNGKGFVLSGTYKATGARFEHGTAQFTVELTRNLSGGAWRVTNLKADNIQIDGQPKLAPTPAPEATPLPPGATPAVSPGANPTASPGIVPAASPAASALPSASPGPTTSTIVTDAAAPTPAGTPTPAATPVPSPAAVPAATVAPTPAASAAPSASPVPTTGG